MPEDDDAPQGPVNCPKCRGRMMRKAVGDVEVDHCASCGGVWLDVMEKERLLESGAAAKADLRSPAGVSRKPHEDKVLTCPRDKSRLIRMTDLKQHHIHFESCTVCGGLFFDAGELKDLSELTLRERVKSFFGR